jgi:hypothetical protein
MKYGRASFQLNIGMMWNKSMHIFFLNWYVSARYIRHHLWHTTTFCVFFFSFSQCSNVYRFTDRWLETGRDHFFTYFNIGMFSNTYGSDTLIQARRSRIWLPMSLGFFQIEALCFKPESRGIYSRLRNWIFKFTYSFLPHSGPSVWAAS